MIYSKCACLTNYDTMIRITLWQFDRSF